MEHVSESSKQEILFEAIRMARLSEWIYDDTDNGYPSGSVPIQEPISKVIMLGSVEESTQGAAILTEEKIYLVFRGSQSPFHKFSFKKLLSALKNPIKALKSAGALINKQGMRDWALNFKVLFRREFYGIKAHRGFVKAAEEVLDQVQTIVHDHPALKLVEIGGHSLGGNVATAIAVALNYLLREAAEFRQLKLITLGQPKFSTRRQLNLALRFIPYIRVQNGSDLIPRLLRGLYSHAGLNLYLSNKGELLWDPGYVRKFVDRFFTFRERGSDHRASDYLNELLSHAKSA